MTKDEWVGFSWRYHLNSRSAEQTPLVGSRMELVSKVSPDARLVLHIFLDIPTHYFDLGNLLEDPEMPALLPPDHDAGPESEMERTAGRMYAALLADPAASFADYQLVAKDGAAFPVHRCVLATASAPLGVMLNSKMTEGTGDAVEIRNASAETVRHLRAFIYKGTLDERLTDRLSKEWLAGSG